MADRANLADGLQLCVELIGPDGTVTPASADNEFSVDLALSEPISPSNGRDVVVDVSYQGSEACERSVRLRVVIEEAADPWWLIPGLFYGENRPADSFRLFPRFASGAGDPAAMVSDHWAFRADRAATPAVFAWGTNRGAALVGAESTALGMTGVGFAHHGRREAASIHLTFPFREEPISYVGNEQPEPADVASWTWQPGARQMLRARLHLLSTDRHEYAPALREVFRRSQGEGPVIPWVSLSEAAELAAHGLHRWHYDPDPGVLLETIGFDREVSGQDGQRVDRQAMHVGWVSGIPWAYALLRHARRVGDQSAAQAARHVIDFVCSALSPSGTFWGVWYRESGWSQSWSPVPGGLHARTLGEATLFLLRALHLESENESASGEENALWAIAARSNLDVIVARARPDGNLGALHDAKTGEVLSWDGAAALTWMAALCEAEILDEDGTYLAAAERSGEYYSTFVQREFIHGAPEDVGLAPTSEDGYAAVMAYMALYRRTGRACWLDLAQRAADWMLTFRYTYNVSFDPRTTLGVHRFATRGADNASPSNQHLHAYGLICTQEMLDLADALDDEYYRDRALETLACFRQLVPRVDGELNAYRGMITERYYHTTCFQPKGMLLTLAHAWSAGVLLLGAEQALSAGAGSTFRPD